MGECYWITGLAGSGKSTLATALYNHLLDSGKRVVLLDGDILRGVFGVVDDYTLPKRLELAFGYSRLCKMLVEQGVIVIIATISLFHTVHHFNRKHIPGYTEVYIKASMSLLRQRDQKQLYSAAENDQQANVLGVNASFEEPLCPDVLLDISTDVPIGNLVRRVLAKV